ncbi:hypothetical protein MRX96_012490 [Rhipicephalus microplus]
MGSGDCGRRLRRAAQYSEVERQNCDRARAAEGALPLASRATPTPREALFSRAAASDHARKATQLLSLEPKTARVTLKEYAPARRMYLLDLLAKLRARISRKYRYILPIHF